MAISCIVLNIFKHKDNQHTIARFL